MSDQRQQSESNEFKPSRLNRIFAIIHTVLCAAVLVSSVGFAAKLRIQAPEEGLAKFLSFVSFVWALGTLLLLIGCVRDLRRPTEKGERILSWLMLVYFALLSLIIGRFSFGPPGSTWEMTFATFFFEAILLGLFSSMARIFSLPSPEEKQHDHRA